MMHPQPDTLAALPDHVAALWLGLYFVAVAGALAILGIARGGHPGRRRP